MKIDIIDTKTGMTKSVRADVARVLVKLKRARLAQPAQRAPEPVQTVKKADPVPYETRSVKSTQTKGKGGRPRTTD